MNSLKSRRGCLVASVAGVGGIALTAAPSLGGATSVVAVSELDPNPSNLIISEVGNVSLATARTNVAAAYAAGTGGTLNFQELFQGGSFPNQTSSTTGITIGYDAADPVVASVGASSSVLSFYRNDGGGANGINANINQNGNIISGGYKSVDPGAVSATNTHGDGTSVTGPVDLTTTPPTPDQGTTTFGGGYMGIVNATNCNLVFTTPLSFFGLTALPRGSSRDTLITFTETPIAGGAPVMVSMTKTLITTAPVFFGQSADNGFVLTGVAITNVDGNGVNRYDDLAFITATTAAPEPASLALLGLGMTPLLGRRRRRA